MSFPESPKLNLQNLEHQDSMAQRETQKNMALKVLLDVLGGVNDPDMKEVYEALFDSFLKSARASLERVEGMINLRTGNVDDPMLDEDVVGALAQTDLLELNMAKHRLDDLENYLNTGGTDSRLSAAYFMNAIASLKNFGLRSAISRDVRTAVLPKCEELRNRLGAVDMNDKSVRRKIRSLDAIDDFFGKF